MSFAQLGVDLYLNIQRFKQGLRHAEREAQRFSSRMAQTAKDNEGLADSMIMGYTRLNDRLHEFGFGLKDVARIFAGITISQGFYTITRNIREATAALWEFNQNLDYAQVTYSALFNDSALASSFIDTLKEFSIDTIFEYTDIEGMARKLSAYGIEYKNLMYIIEGLTSLGTISGDSAALERLAVAIGQINAKGTLKAEEMRQLANAYVPIYDVLREKLHLTEEDLKRVGDLGISSADAINAIIEYANETFGATADAAVFTITGLNNRIVDTLKVMGSAIMTPVTLFYKSLAKYIADSLETIRGIYEQSGLGGVFEHLVPSKEWQQRIRNLLATLQNTFKTILGLFMALWPFIKQTFGGLIDAFTVFLGVLNTIASAVTGVIKSISANTPALNILSRALITAAAAWLLFKIQALGAMVVSGVRAAIVGVAQAVLFLVRALTAHPIITMLTLLGAVLIGVASNASNTNSAINRLIDTFNSFSIGGTVADDVLQAGDAMEEGADQSDKFWESMKDGAEDTEDSVEGAGNAAKKAAKSLLSFDEVFRLQDPSEGAGSGLGSGALDGIGDLSDALSGLGSALVPEIPDLSTFANDFVSTLYNELWDSIKAIASGGATGALIGGLVGFAIGGFVTKTMKGALAGAKFGAKIGTIVGGAFAGFWTDTYKEMEASLQKIAVGAASGALAGGLIGMVVGAFATRTLDGAILGARYGAQIGTVVGGAIGSFWALMSEEMNNAIEGVVVGGGSGALAGALAGFIIGAFSTKTLKGAIAGGQLGTKIGAGVGAVLGGIFGGLEEEVQKWVLALGAGASYGALAGGLAGLILGALATRTMAGAKAGAALGSTIGGVIGTAVMNTLKDSEEGVAAALENMFSGVSAAGVGSLIGGLVGMIVGAIVGAFAGGIGAVPGAKAGATIGAAIGALGGMVYQALVDSGSAEAVDQYFSELLDKPLETLTKFGVDLAMVSLGIHNAVKKMLIEALANIIIEIANFTTNVHKVLTTIGKNILTGLANFLANFIKSVIEWCAGALVSISEFFTNLYKNTVDFFEGIYTGVLNWLAELDIPIISWLAKKLSSFVSWLANILKYFTDFGHEFYAHFVQGFTSLYTKLVEWLKNVYTKLVGWTADVSSNVADLLNIISKLVTEGFANVMKKFTDFCGNIWNGMLIWFKNLAADVEDGWEDLWSPDTWKSGWDSIKSWFSDLFTDIGEWFKSLGKSVGSWWNGLWDDKKASVNISSSGGTGGVRIGHARGGIFNREHIARFAEGNKAEAVIPLENASAMQPFVNAISDGILQGLMPVMATGGGSQTLPPMYVGTLIADERGLQQLYKKFEVYEAKELARKGLS